MKIGLACKSVLFSYNTRNSRIQNCTDLTEKWKKTESAAASTQLTLHRLQNSLSFFTHTHPLSLSLSLVSIYYVFFFSLSLLMNNRLRSYNMHCYKALLLPPPSFSGREWKIKRCVSWEWNMQCIYYKYMLCDNNGRDLPTWPNPDGRINKNRTAEFHWRDNRT